MKIVFILSYKLKEQMTNNLNETHKKGFNTIHTSFNPTNIIFRKMRPQNDLQIYGLKTLRNFEINGQKQRGEWPKFQKLPKTKNSIDKQSSPDKTCTNFMKNYIDKLKKQRKRHNKKLQENKNHYSKERRTQSLCTGKEVFVLDTKKDSYHSQLKTNNFFVLEKMPNNNNIGGMNTIQINFENQVYPKNSVYSSPEQQNALKLDKLIEDIGENKIRSEQRKSEKKVANKMSSTLPRVNKSKQQRSKGEQNKKKANYDFNINMRSLEPWKEEQNPFQFSIEEYRHKK